jgi:threonine dehydrogenase-like Zn-dependent dehydrogenase
MKGVVYLGKSEVEVRDFPQPEPGPGQVVIESKVAGLCGSDLHKYHSSRTWAQAREGMISGHEPTGIVAAVGPNVDQPSVGDRVCVYHRLGCGHCMDCRSGNAAFCDAGSGAFGRTQDGSHADYMLTDARYCLPLHDDLSFAVATQLACTAGTSFAALRKIPAHLGDTLVVFGLGPVGLSGLLWGMGMGYRGIGVDTHPYRVALAKKVGKGLVVDAANDNPVDAIRDLTGGKGVGGVLECSGNPIARRQAAAVASRGSTVVYVGGGPNPNLAVDFGDVLQKDLTIRGNSVFSMASYYAAVEFLLQHPVPFDEIVTHRFTIEQAVEAFSLFDTGETGKVIFEWDE